MVVVGRPHTLLYLFLAASWVTFAIGESLLQVGDNVGEAILGSRITDALALVNRQATPCPTTTTSKTTTPCTTTTTCATTSTATRHSAADSTLTLTFVVVSSTPVTTTVVSSGSGDKGQVLVSSTLSRTNSRSSDLQTTTTQMMQLQKTSPQPSADPTTLSSSTTAVESIPATTAKLGAGASPMRTAYIGIALGIVLALLLLILGVVLLLRRRRSNAKHFNSASGATRATDLNVTPYDIPPPPSPTAIPAHNHDLEKLVVSTQQTPAATGNGQTSAAALATFAFTPVREGDVTGQNAINQRIRVVRDEMMHLQAKLPSEEPLARRAIRLADENGTTEGVADAELTMERMQEMMAKLQDQVSRLQRQQQTNWAARLSIEPPPDYERGQDAASTDSEGESKTEVL